MEPMVEEFARIAADVAVSDPQIPVVSNVTAELAGPRFGSAQYWPITYAGRCASLTVCVSWNQWGPTYSWRSDPAAG